MTTEERLNALLFEFFGIKMKGNETLGDIQELAQQLECLQEAKEILNEQNNT